MLNQRKPFNILVYYQFDQQEPIQERGLWFRQSMKDCVGKEFHKLRLAFVRVNNSIEIISLTVSHSHL